MACLPSIEILMKLIALNLMPCDGNLTRCQSGR